MARGSIKDIRVLNAVSFFIYILLSFHVHERYPCHGPSSDSPFAWYYPAADWMSGGWKGTMFVAEFQMETGNKKIIKSENLYYENRKKEFESIRLDWKRKKSQFYPWFLHCEKNYLYVFQQINFIYLSFLASLPPKRTIPPHQLSSSA